MEKEVLKQIQAWQGEINTPIGAAMRQKAYECFNGLIAKLGSELSSTVSNPKVKDATKLKAIKAILAKYNIYNE